MTSVPFTGATGGRRLHRSWRIWRIGVLSERAYRIRLFIVPATLGVQLYLYDRLWTAVYRHTTSAGGLDVRQAVTYSLMALLAAHIRWGSRGWSMDSVQMRVREGTIAYWFIRPISPGRYYMWRQAGDIAYGAMWAVAGYLVLRAVDVITAPGSAAHLLVFGVSLVLGQIVLYYLGQLVDLATFWLVSNGGVTRMYYFIQDLLSGVFVPLWFMPAWLITASVWLPFNAGINVPLSLYVGRTAPSDAARQLALQACWVLLLAAITRWAWTRAARRVTVQGG